MNRDYYELDLNHRRRLPADTGFVRDDLRVWTHRDGGAVGEGVAAALTDEAFCRYLCIDWPQREQAAAESVPGKKKDL